VEGRLRPLEQLLGPRMIGLEAPAFGSVKPLQPCAIERLHRSRMRGNVRIDALISRDETSCMMSGG
jgi:hypothetical protein